MELKVDFDILKAEYIEKLVEISHKGKLTNVSRQSLEKELENKISHYIVALNKEVVVGYIGIWNIAGEGEIIDVAVDTDFQRCGIGSMLIEKMVEYCQENYVSVLHLEVRVGNIPAISLYEKFGFKKVGMREKYYTDGEDAILMDFELV